MERVVNSLVTLQNQINSLVAVIPPNRQAPDLLTSENEGTCKFSGEECCYFLNQSEILTTKVKEVIIIIIIIPHRQQVSTNQWNK